MKRLGAINSEDNKWLVFQAKPTIVEAFQAEEQILVETATGEVIASPGDWIVRDGSLKVLKREEFEERYFMIGDEEDRFWLTF